MTVDVKEHKDVKHYGKEKDQNAAPLSRQRGHALAGVERRIAALARPYALALLRISLGLVFVWFGALKAIEVSPVGTLVAHTLPFLDRSWFVPVLGGMEILLGLALVVGRLLGLVCGVMILHLAGTFLVLVTQPQLAFQHGNPLLLTTVGEFVVKNLVLICAGLVLAARLGEPRVPRRGRAHE